MDEIAVLSGYTIIFAWVFSPLISILRFPNARGPEKLLWAAGTFVPFGAAVACAKFLQWLSPTHPFAREILDSRTGAFLLVMSLLVGGWTVRMIYRVVLERRARRQGQQERSGERGQDAAKGNPGRFTRSTHHWIPLHFVQATLAYVR